MAGFKSILEHEIAMEAYDSMTDYYQFVYGDYYDFEFFRKVALEADGHVLEVACGTGRLLLKLMQEGVDITGLDISEKMLGRLRRDAKALGLKPDVHHGDMRDFSLDRKFKLIFLAYRSFSHMLTREDMKNALLTFKRHLAEGGKLVIDMYNHTYDDLKKTGRFHHLDTFHLNAEDGTPFTQEWYLHYKPETNVASYRVTVTVWGEKHTFTTQSSLISPDEMQGLLEECGYRNIDPYPDTRKGSDTFWIAEN